MIMVKISAAVVAFFPIVFIIQNQTTETSTQNRVWGTDKTDSIAKFIRDADYR